MKAPVHTAYLDTLVAAVPEAVHVQTHRDPVAVVTEQVVGETVDAMSVALTGAADSR